MSSSLFLFFIFMIINEELTGAIKSFCSMLPNINDLHHPNDLRRLMEVAYHLYRSNIIFSDIQQILDEELSKNNLFESNEEIRNQFITEDVKPVMNCMLSHINHLNNLNHLK